MKELLLQYAKYNVWANKRLIDTILKLDTSLPEQELVSSYPTIKLTVSHIWSAEYIWLQRLLLVEQPVWIEKVFTGSFEEACAEWLKVSEEILGFVERQFDDKGLEHVVQYYSTEKKSFKLPAFTILNHVLNHTTQHRGQLITMLRQVGVKKIPAMDLSYYVNNK